MNSYILKLYYNYDTDWFWWTILETLKNNNYEGTELIIIFITLRKQIKIKTLPKDKLITAPQNL